MGVFWVRSIASVRGTASVRGRSVAGVLALLVVGTLTQGVAYTLDRRSEAAVSAMSRISRLSAAEAEVEMTARRVEREPEIRSHRDVLAAVIEGLESEERSLALADFDSPVDNTGWARVSLALASLNHEARSMDAEVAIAPRAAQRLRARAVALADEVVATRTQLEADIGESSRRLRWLSWGAWVVMMM